MTAPLMPKATAVWLIDNTTLTFDQIADFCEMHPLEVKGIADGDVSQGIIGVDPILNGQLTKAEIERCAKDPKAKLQFSERMRKYDDLKAKKKAKYTPVARRQDKPDAVAWFIRNHPEVGDAQVAKLVGTTKSTIETIRNRSHWNSNNIRPRDPVLLGLCSQVELDRLLDKCKVEVKDAPEAAAE